MPPPKPRIGRYVINLDSGDGRRIVCGWDDCERAGLEMYKQLEHQHPVDRPCGRADQVAHAAGAHAHCWQVFCSERHRLYWVNATGRNATRSIESTGRAYGNLPVGSRGMIR
jgi:hypothetical protein